jgi:uncharacterized protein
MGRASPAPPGPGPSQPDRLEPVALRELLQLGGTRHWVVDQHLDELDSLTPVRGELTAVHGGNILEVSGEASTIVTLCCDRCLQTFNHPLTFRCRELIWLGEAGGLGHDPGEDYGERLDPHGSFDPAHWLFEQLQLRRPLQNRCGPDCPGPATWSCGGAAEAASPGPPSDPRWEGLRQLR